MPTAYLVEGAPIRPDEEPIQISTRLAVANTPWFPGNLVAFPVQGVLADGTVVSSAYGQRKANDPKSSYIQTSTSSYQFMPSAFTISQKKKRCAQ